MCRMVAHNAFGRYRQLLAATVPAQSAT